MKKNKPIIKVKDGRSYLHTESVLEEKIKVINIFPMGMNIELIKQMIKKYKCKIVFID